MDTNAPAPGSPGPVAHWPRCRDASGHALAAERLPVDVQLHIVATGHHPDCAADDEGGVEVIEDDGEPDVPAIETTSTLDAVRQFVPPEPDPAASANLAGPAEPPRVLCVARADLDRGGHFVGYLPDGAGRVVELLYGPRAEPLWIERARAEGDPQFKQIIPYLVCRWRDRVAVFERTKAGGEAKLHGRRTIGLGGHVELAADCVGTHPRDFAGPIAHCIRRELDEEVELGRPFDALRRIGLVNDEDGVGAVHLGVVYECRWGNLPGAAPPPVACKDGTLKFLGWLPLLVISALMDFFPDTYETWSRHVLRGLVEAEGAAS